MLGVAVVWKFAWLKFLVASDVAMWPWFVSPSCPFGDAVESAEMEACSFVDAVKSAER